MDLDDKLFESDTSDNSDDENENVVPDSVTVVPDSVLTPDNGSDGGKGSLTSPQTVPHFMTPQSHDYPTPPSNDPTANNYHPEELMPTEDRSVTCDKKRDTYHQLLFDHTSYSALGLKKYLGPLPSTYRPDNTPAPVTSQPIMLNSPLKTPPQSCLENLDITAKLESFSTELKESGLLTGSPDLSRTMHMSASKEEMTLLSIGEKIMQSPDHKFAFPSAFAQTNIKRELSDLPKLQGGQFLIKFGDSYLNKFLVSSEDVMLPGGYSCLQNENKSVLLDTTRMEIYAQNEHKSTVGYLPKSSISIALYQSLESKVVKPQSNSTPFAAVRNSRFSPSFLKILQQGVRNVVNFEAKVEEPTFEETMATNSAIDKVGKLLESRLPSDLVLQKPRTCILPWKSFSSLAEKYNTGTGEQPQPALLLGHEQQWMSVSPQSVPVWISKGMEPYSGKRDVHYLVVIPDNAHIIHNIHNFFENLSTVYELSHLGHHKQLATKIREGVMRVSKKSGEKVAREPLDPWFGDKNDPESLTWQMYAKTCQHLLAKYLASFLTGKGSSEHRNIVIYFIDPFKTRDLHTKAQLVTRCFNSMQEELNKTKNTHFIMQSIPADYVSGNHMNLVQLTSTLKSVCFSVYNQTLKHVKMKPPTTCLTGFGPVSKDVVLEGGAVHMTGSLQEPKKAGATAQQHVYSPLCVLKNKPHTETVTSKLDTLFCAYSLSHDTNWAIVAISDSSGHLLDTALYAIDEPSRQGVTPAVLNKIWSFCLSMVESYRAMWCLVVSKMGNVTDAEDRFWSEKFKSVVSWNAQLQERCTECVLSNKVHTFGIASVSLLSVLNSAHVNILPLLNRPKPLDFRTSSQILLLSPQQPLVEPLDRFKKLQEDSFTFYSGPEHSRDKKRKILSSAYLASSAAYSELPRHMGSGKSSVLLGNLHQHIVTMSSKRHILLSDNHPLTLRYILQQLDALSWLQINPTTRARRSPLPLHMFTVANIYSALQGMTFVPP
ncbi:mediator of RNA polymerase II transcription subunit 13-like [Bolinopsis microptera]|uniref:mediator of RNA polymerase II transcription subunit 13-like n=1 Tax=Bolinopsis microptera TaxID=2820187 RepID=UPI00307ABA96